MLPQRPPTSCPSRPTAKRATALIARAVNKVLEWIADLLDNMVGTSSNGHLGLVLLVLLFALIIVVVLWRAGVLRTTRSNPRARLRHRQAPYCVRLPRAGGAGGGRGQLRGRRCEAASVPASRSSPSALCWTTEPAERRTRLWRTPGAQYRLFSDVLRPAALVFTEVVYGNRPGTPERYALVVAADEAARKVSTRMLVQG